MVHNRSGVRQTCPTCPTLRGWFVSVRSRLGFSRALRSGARVKAFRGELVPTEAELVLQGGRDYEPASALLARIRAARAANEGKTTRRPRAGDATLPTTTAKPGRRKNNARPV